MKSESDDPSLSTTCVRETKADGDPVAAYAAAREERSIIRPAI